MNKEFTHTATEVTTIRGIKDWKHILVYETKCFWRGNNGKQYRKQEDRSSWRYDRRPRREEGSAIVVLEDITPIKDKKIETISSGYNGCYVDDIKKMSREELEKVVIRLVTLPNHMAGDFMFTSSVLTTDEIADVIRGRTL